jgi:hypothetical protein
VIDRDAEDPDDRVADELVDDPAVPFDDAPGVVEERLEHQVERFRVGLAGRRRTGEVAEQQGHRLASAAQRAGRPGVGGLCCRRGRRHG